VISGDNLDVTCTGWGWPTPYVLWTREDYFDHIFGVDDPGVNMLNVTTDHGLSLIRAKLHVDGLNSTDQKKYMCVMVNELGFVNTTTYVRVKGQSSICFSF
jgi:Immunoglobulin I-set domain